ncbi:hypothetical protein GCM10025783_08800 [Amnibacterium soli]|uniref:DUF3558 domain-containing protein n=1 Tax=Amnibacterium soli TaxID=1282736 RepID=A0ABP8YX55_9MICO
MHDEHLDDRVADEIRGRLMREVVADRERSVRGGRPTSARARTPWFPVLTSIAVAVVVVAVSIAVLLAAPRPVPADPQPTQTHVFGGSCGSLLPGAAARAAVGTALGRPLDVTRTQAAGSGSGLTSLYAVGGLECTWTPAEADVADGAALDVGAAPAALAPKAAEAPYCYRVGEKPVQTACTFSRRSHGIWFTGRLTVERGGRAVVLARLRVLGRAFDAAAREPGAAAPLAKRTAGAWPRGTDCSALVREARLASVLQAPGLAGSSGNGPAEPSDAQLRARDHLGATPCIAETQGDGGPAGITSLAFSVYPDAAAVRALVDADPSARTVRTASGRRVIVTRDRDGAQVIHAFDGPDYLQVSPDGRPVQVVLRAVDPLLRVLDTTR